MNALVEALRIRLREVLREDLGGTYGVGVSATQTSRPIDRYTITINYGSDPERADELADAVFAERTDSAPVLRQ